MSDAAAILNPLPVNPAAVDAPVTAPQGAPNGVFAGVLSAHLLTPMAEVIPSQLAGAGQTQALQALDPMGQGLPLQGKVLPPGLPSGTVLSHEWDSPVAQLLATADQAPLQTGLETLTTPGAAVAGEDIALLDNPVAQLPTDVETAEMAEPLTPLFDPLAMPRAMHNPTGTAPEASLTATARPQSAAVNPNPQGLGLGLAVAPGLQPSQPMPLTGAAQASAKGMEAESQGSLGPVPLGLGTRLAKALQTGASHSVTGTLQGQAAETKPNPSFDNPLRLMEGRLMTAAADMSAVSSKVTRPSASEGLSVSLGAANSSQAESGFWGTLMGVAQPAGTTQASGLPLLALNTPAHHPNWSQELGQRVTWMANNELREAQIQMNPRHLGPIEVRISYGHEQQMSVNFVAQNAQARDMLDAALPRLREMFESQGLNLGDANVSEESFTNREQQFSTQDPDNGKGSYGARISDDDSLNEDDKLQILSNSVEIEGLFNAYV